MTLMMRGHAAAARVDQVGRGAREFQRRAERGAAQPMVDVVAGFVRVERRQVIADRDPLPELLQLRRRELVAQVRLADQDDLQQLRLLGLEVREHPQLLERAEAEVLRFVDDQQDEPSGEPLIDQVLRQVAQQQRLAPPVGSRPKSIMIVSSSSRGSSIVFTIRPTVVWLSRFRSSVWSSVVLPEPISPVMTMNPAWLSTP